MRRIFNYVVLAAVAVALLMSCSKDFGSASLKEYTYTFALSNDDSKAILNGNHTEWEDGDRLGVYTSSETLGISYNRYADIDISKNPVEFKISSVFALSNGDYVYCYFPYNKSNSNGDAQDPKKVTLSIPSEQYGKMNAMPMVSIPYQMNKSVEEKTDEPIANIKMRNLGGVFQFNIYSTNVEYQNEKIEKVVFEADVDLAGSFVYDITATELAGITGLSESAIAVNCESLPISATLQEASKVMMVVAPGSYSGSLVVTTDVAIYTISIPLAKQVERSHIKPLNVDLNNRSRELRSQATYTLSFTRDTSASNYTTERNVVCDEISWKLYGNQSMGDYLRVGGKNTTATDRTFTSKDIIPGEVSYVVINHNGIGNGSNSAITINSFSIEASTTATFTAETTEKVTTTDFLVKDAGALRISFEDSHEDCFYRVTMNYKITGSNNCYLTVNNIELWPGSVGPKYSITNYISEGGNVTANKSSAKTGEKVTLRVSPAGGKVLSENSLMVYKTGDESITVNVSDNSFIMPNYDVTIKAAFEDGGFTTKKVVKYSGAAKMNNEWQVVTTGSAPAGSSVTYDQSYTTLGQMTSGNWVKYTITGFTRKMISKISLSMKSNSRGGAGWYYFNSGTNTLSSIGSAGNGVAFNQSAWNNSWSTSYVTVTPAMSDNTHVVAQEENLEVFINATVNSLYCEYIEIEYYE